VGQGAITSLVQCFEKATNRVAFFMRFYMDRQIVYPGAVPLETDLLNTNKFAMIGLARLASAVLGSDTCLNGLHCSPASPVLLQVHVSAGEIYCLKHIEETAYSTLPSDHSGTILKQGLTGGVTFDAPAPMQKGMSINYLVQAAYVEADTGGIVLPFYNAADPSKAFNGQGNAGEALPCVRQGICRLSLKTGTAAADGTQPTPEADPGYISAWIITVAAGAKGITADNIRRAPDAPFLPSGGVYQSVQQSNLTFAHDTGSANTYAASYQPPISSLIDGMRLTFKAREPNTGKSVFSVRRGESHALFSQAKKELEGGEITAGGFITVEWDSAAQVWLMCGNSGGALPVSDAVKPGHAMNLGQGDERYIKKDEEYSEEQAKKTFLPLTGGELSGSLTVKEELKVEKDVRAANLHAGNALYDGVGNVYGVHWRNAKDDESLKKAFPEKNPERGWLTHWLDQKFKEQSDAINTRPTWSELDGLYIRGIRLGSRITTKGRRLEGGEGSVMTQWDATKKLSQDYKATFRPLQIDLTGRGEWKTIGQDNK